MRAHNRPIWTISDLCGRHLCSVVPFPLLPAVQNEKSPAIIQRNVIFQRSQLQDVIPSKAAGAVNARACTFSARYPGLVIVLVVPLCLTLQLCRLGDSLQMLVDIDLLLDPV